MRLLIPGAILAEIAATVVGVSSGGLDNSSFLQLAGLILGGGAMAAWISGRHRKQSGEDRSNAAQSVGDAAAEMAGAVKDVLTPYREENARLLGRISELQNRLSDKTEQLAEIKVALTKCQTDFEKYRHQVASDITAVAAQKYAVELQLARREEEIYRLQVKLGEEPGTRENDPEEPPNLAE